MPGKLKQTDADGDCAWSESNCRGGKGRFFSGKARPWKPGRKPDFVSCPCDRTHRKDRLTNCRLLLLQLRRVAGGRASGAARTGTRRRACTPGLAATRTVRVALSASRAVLRMLALMFGLARLLVAAGGIGRGCIAAGRVAAAGRAAAAVRVAAAV